MTLLQPLGRQPRYLKAGFLGFGGSGKTWTAAELCIGLHRYFELKTPIGAFDTEGGIAAQRDRIASNTGVDVLGATSRSFDELLQFTEEVSQAGIEVVLIDSITHVWRRLCQDKLRAVNNALRERYGVARVVMRRKEHYSKPAPDALIDAMAKEVDVAIAALGG